MTKKIRFSSPKISHIKLDPPTRILEFEIFAITLLMCTPSDLHSLWLNKKKSPSDWRDYLLGLKLSNDAVTLGVAIMSDDHLRPHRHFFKAITQSLREYGLTYDVVGPHPGGGEAKKIVEAMQLISKKK
jgi:hypothetical protein